MSLRDRWVIDKTQLPSTFTFEDGNKSFYITMYYRELTDNFYITLSDINGVTLVAGEKVVYGEPLFKVTDPRLPSTTYIPLDESGQSKEVNFSTFGVTVFIFADDIIDNVGETDEQAANSLISNTDVYDATLDETTDPEDGVDDSPNDYGIGDDELQLY